MPRWYLELNLPDDKEVGAHTRRRATKELSPVSQKFKETGANLKKPLEFIVTVNRPGKARLDPHRKIAAKDDRAMVEKITLKGQLELAFPEGIRDLRATYDKRLDPRKYLAESLNVFHCSGG